MLVTFVLLPAASMIAGAGAGLLGEALRQDDVRRSLVLTVTAALISTVIGFVAGVPLAYLLARSDFPGKRASRASSTCRSSFRTRPPASPC